MHILTPSCHNRQLKCFPYLNTIKASSFKSTKMKRIVMTAVVAIVATVMYLAGPSEAVSCDQIRQALTPCSTYLTGGAGPRPECCNGVQSIRTITPTKADRIQACNCLKQAASALPNFKPDMASQLPAKCRMSFPYPISPTVDCSTIS